MKMYVIKSGYAPAPLQTESSTYSFPDQPINHCYAPDFNLNLE